MILNFLITLTLVNNSSLDSNESSFTELKLTNQSHYSIETILSSVYYVGLITFCFSFFCCFEENVGNNEQIQVIGNNGIN